MSIPLLKEEDISEENTVNETGTVEHEETTVVVTEHEEILKEIDAIMQKRGFKCLPGEDVQGDITRFYIKGENLTQLIVTPWADEEILEEIARGAE